MTSRTRETDVDRLLAALANPTRREILDALRDGEKSAGTLGVMFDIARPSVAEHVRTLVNSGLASERRDGRNILYSLRPEPLESVAAWLSTYETFWRDRLASLRTTLDEMDDA